MLHGNGQSHGELGWGCPTPQSIAGGKEEQSIFKVAGVTPSPVREENSL